MKADFRFRNALDMMASVAMIAASLTLVWTAVAARAPIKPKEKPLPREPISLAGAKLDGNASAQVAVVEFSDFECPYCGSFARTTLPTIKDRYVDTGKVLLAFRHFPLTAIHPHALEAATFAQCAEDGGHFWQMHDELFRRQKELDSTSLRAHAERTGVLSEAFFNCLQGPGKASVKVDTEQALALAVTGTPTLFVGRVIAPGSVLVTDRIGGAATLEQLTAVIDRALAGKDR